VAQSVAAQVIMVDANIIEGGREGGRERKDIPAGHLTNTLPTRRPMDGKNVHCT